LEQPNFVSRALPRAKTGFGAAANEMATDPRMALAPGQTVPGAAIGRYAGQNPTLVGLTGTLFIARRLGAPAHIR